MELCNSDNAPNRTSPQPMMRRKFIFLFFVAIRGGIGRSSCWAPAVCEAFVPIDFYGQETHFLCLPVFIASRSLQTRSVKRCTSESEGAFKRDSAYHIWHQAFDVCAAKASAKCLSRLVAPFQVRRALHWLGAFVCVIRIILLAFIGPVLEFLFLRKPVCVCVCAHLSLGL